MTEKTGIHPYQFLFRGSTKIGFSISPNRKKRKAWQRFSAASGLDLAIVDPRFYETLDEQVGGMIGCLKTEPGYIASGAASNLSSTKPELTKKGRHDSRGISCPCARGTKQLDNLVMPALCSPCQRRCPRFGI